MTMNLDEIRVLEVRSKKVIYNQINRRMRSKLRWKITKARLEEDLSPTQH